MSDIYDEMAQWVAGHCYGLLESTGEAKAAAAYLRAKIAETHIPLAPMKGIIEVMPDVHEGCIPRARVEAIIKARQCGDHSCNWGHSGGMGTNGGCGDGNLSRAELRVAYHKLAHDLCKLLEDK